MRLMMLFGLEVIIRMMMMVVVVLKVRMMIGW